MKQIKFPRQFMFLVICFLFLQSCNSPVGQVSTSTMTLTPRPTFTPTITPSATITSTSTPLSTSFTTLNTTINQSGKWNLSLPYSDSELPDVFISISDGYSLNPNFDVNSIRLSYEWWGLADPVLDYQRIDRRGDAFFRGDTPISSDEIKAFVRSINHLHSEPQMMESITHTDDYPIWAIEVTIGDNANLLLYSTSNGRHFAPWNVIYNGKIYTQFNGEIASELSSLFDVQQGEPFASTSTGQGEEGYISVESTGWPGQLSNGYSGLLAIQSGFNYWPNPQKGELDGYMEGRSSIGGMGHMIVGSITELLKIELNGDSTHIIVCPFTTKQTSDPKAAVWSFVCPVAGPGASGPYHYPIQVTFKTDKGNTYTVSGELFGRWEPGTAVPTISFPDEIEKILTASPSVQDLMTDHQILLLNFNADVDPNTGLMDHNWSGNIVLLGQAKINENTYRYSVTTKVGIKDSQLIQWDLDRNKLKSLLQDVLDQAITKPFLERDPNLVFNLYYQENPDNPILSKMELRNCADLPYSDTLPSIGQPLRGFAFNQSWDFRGIQILLINGKTRIQNFDINPLHPEDAIWASLLPVELQPAGVPPLSNISLWSWSPAVAISWDANASPSDIELYKKGFQSWPGKMEIESWGIRFNSTTFGITSDGHLKLVNCGIQ